MRCWYGVLQPACDRGYVASGVFGFADVAPGAYGSTRGQGVELEYGLPNALCRWLTRVRVEVERAGSYRAIVGSVGEPK